MQKSCISDEFRPRAADFSGTDLLQLNQLRKSRTNFWRIVSGTSFNVETFLKFIALCDALKASDIVHFAVEFDEFVTFGVHTGSCSEAEP